jgi:hypothetical protein
MSDQKEISELRARIAELEGRLQLPQKVELSKHAAASAEALKKALQLPDTSVSSDITKRIVSLADKSNVIVEWSARELGQAAQSSCCCCCCCCRE